MPTKLILELAMMGQVVVSGGVLAVLVSKRLAMRFSFLCTYALAATLDITSRTLLLFFHREIGLSPKDTYALYFYSCWVFSFVEHALLLCVIFQIFRSAMAPFKGLSRLGTMVFKWVCCVAVLVSVGVMIVPGKLTPERYFSVTGQFEQSISILTVCLLLFVCFAIRHLGMTYRSHVFGASLGLGVMGMLSLVQASWTAAHGMPPLYSQPYIVEAFVAMVPFLIWGGYFLQPEQRRELVLLPTTSPYFVWNEISAALGDHPGVVAVSGFTPESLSPAERLVLGASSRREQVATKVRVSVAEQATATGTQR